MNPTPPTPLALTNAVACNTMCVGRAMPETGATPQIYRDERTGELHTNVRGPRETTWDRHPPPADGKARIWKRDDGVTTQYPWFYYLPGGRIGSIARTWDEAMDAINVAYVDAWITTWTANAPWNAGQ